MGDGDWAALFRSGDCVRFGEWQAPGPYLPQASRWVCSRLRDVNTCFRFCIYARFRVTVVGLLVYALIIRYHSICTRQYVSESR